MESALKGRIALVTGGSRGIGLAVVQALAERGCRVAFSGVRPGSVENADEELRAFAGSVKGIVADVREQLDVTRMVDETVAAFGGLDILVNNAGVGRFKPLVAMAAEDWHDVIDTNVTGVFYCCQAAIPHLKRRGGGWIINVSSLAGKNPFPDGTAYCASKAALNAFSEALMQEVRFDGIRVSYVLPGSVRTDFAGTAGGDDDWKLAPEDVAQVIVDLVAHDRRSLPSRVEIRPAVPKRRD